MKNLNNNKKNTGYTIPGAIDGFSIPLGITIEEKINTLQSIKDSMATCMMASMNDELAFDMETTNNLQLFYMQAEAQIKKLQSINFRQGATA